ncbi:FAD-dependent oxidoreductase [Gordonia amicalis]|uniref:FAD-dependent oxidoreductase n=1 Tax=Gordonia amicalis TaxID=89053 RepID=UPI0002A64B45|nr:FAD-dependent oxidoreductase [Gordonia amicalis]MBA5848144.1 FAD-dependent oxidoreductase [Gordonia amicalis]MCZ0915184.1 FAD-dependent oxidoreductase [Gordonia amicalis]MDV7172540.1 FAD-dependent oxidoreductase [Gordonia amicalis]NKX76128.1 FAD-dependent oxidoreductase [Gordonia amicalis]UKO92801.1 FAD-dependent oxidoreductase [Gordonia amicalis]
MKTLWFDPASDTDHAGLPDVRPETTPFGTVDTYDQVVVGGGITGLTTGLLLARAGQKVTVLERRHIGAAATGHTTGKLSLLQGTRLSSIASRHGKAAVHDYVEANREGQAWLRHYLAHRGLRVDERAALTFAATASGAKTVEKEFEACRAHDIPVEHVDCPELPFDVHTAIRLEGQAQIDPMVVLRALADDFRAHGGHLYEGVHVQGLRHGSPHTVTTDAGDLRAESVILATGVPFLDRAGFFARVHPQRSYAAAFVVDGEIPREMYLGADNPSVSLRTAPRHDHDGELLLVGGFGHEVGRTKSERQHALDMIAWTEKHFPTARMVARWSAQDYTTIDELPYVGQLLPGMETVQVATGFAKWGLTNGVAAALSMTGRILGSEPPWSKTLRPWRTSEVTKPGSLASAVSANAQVAAYMAGGYLGLLKPADTSPAEGDGSVGHSGAAPKAVCTVAGQTRSVAPLCTHLYGVLRWNDAEQSWDCPLHGSRFSHTGVVLEGPATRNLYSQDASDD